jgi:predicted MFS family arabinose efflux permease
LRCGALCSRWPGLSLGLIFIARLALGCAESCVGTGAIAWGMGQVGHQHTARVISWNGVATYGALAAGAPLGVLIQQRFGFAAIGIVSLLLPLFALPLARMKRATTVEHGERSPFRTVATRVVPYGIGLALGSIGFGCIATFITLFYGSHGWDNAALTLTVFGGVFVGVRFVLARTINWFGGYRVAMVSLAVEAIGLVTLCVAGHAWVAIAGAAIAGLGFSLVFPALGVEAVHRVPPTVVDRRSVCIRSSWTSLWRSPVRSADGLPVAWATTRFMDSPPSQPCYRSCSRSYCMHKLRATCLPSLQHPPIRNARTDECVLR